MASAFVWSSECPSDEEIGLSDCSDDSPELAVLEQPTDTLITSGGTESRVLRVADISTGGAAGKSVGGTTSSRTDSATANMVGKEDPAPQESERAASV